MDNNFKTGDIVKRTSGSFKGMTTGDCATIECVHISSVSLVEYEGYHDYKSLKKVIKDLQGF